LKVERVVGVEDQGLWSCGCCGAPGPAIGARDPQASLHPWHPGRVSKLVPSLPPQTSGITFTMSSIST
jgi:hypothetical protein